MPFGGVFAPRTLLSVNIDPIARPGHEEEQNEHDPVKFAVSCEKAGCNGITVCLREDGRHFQDRDVFAIKDLIRCTFNLEIALLDEMISIAGKVKPDVVTLSTGKNEATTEDGLDVRRHMVRIKETIKLFHDQNIPVSLSIAPDPEMVELSKACEADQIEIHTGPYGNATDKAAISEEIQRIYGAADHAAKLGLKVTAGHGLGYGNIEPVLDARGLVEVVIGRSIIERSEVVGLARAVGEMLEILE